MESAIGVEGMEVTAPYPEANHGSKEWRWGECRPGKRYHSCVSLFHGYERRAPTEEIDADIKRIIEARRIALNLEKETWTGGGENMILMPGLMLELGHFYGARDNKPLTALVTDARLHVRSPWPKDMGAPPAEEKTGEQARVEFSAADWGGDSEKRFCGNSR